MGWLPEQTRAQRFVDVTLVLEELIDRGRIGVKADEEE